MILVELEVPSLGTCYNISINEHQQAGILLEELLDLVRKKCGEAGADTQDTVFLLSLEEYIRYT